MLLLLGADEGAGVTSAGGTVRDEGKKAVELSTRVILSTRRSLRNGLIAWQVASINVWGRRTTFPENAEEPRQGFGGALSLVGAARIELATSTVSM